MGVTIGAALAALALPMAAQAFDPFLVSPDASALDKAPAFQHANMTAEAALAELQSRGILVQREGSVRGVRTPVRLAGRLHGVDFHGALTETQRATSPFEICDARMALALDDFSVILSRHDIDEVVHYSMYRPGAPPAPVRRVRPSGVLPSMGDLPPLPAPDGSGPAAPVNPSGSSPAPQPSASAPPASRHPAGLAIDVAKLHKRSGEWLHVGAHFWGHIGARTCGEGAVVPTDDKARELRAIVCESAAASVFTYVLTPNYNFAHRDHFHMEIKPGARWFLIH